MRKSSLLLTLVLFIFLLSIAPVSYAAIVVPAPGTSTPAKEPDATTINAAFEEFRSLSNKEKKARFKELKKEFKAFKKAKKRTVISAPILSYSLSLLSCYHHWPFSSPG